MAREFSEALDREVAYRDIAPEVFEARLKQAGLPDYVAQHIVMMGELHRAGRYDRLATGVEQVTGRAAMSVRAFVTLHANEFGDRRP